MWPVRSYISKYARFLGKLLYSFLVYRAGWLSPIFRRYEPLVLDFHSCPVKHDSYRI